MTDTSPPEGERSTNGHQPRPGPGRGGPGGPGGPGAEATRITTPKLLLFCALTPATAVALFGLIVSLQQVIAGDDSPGWPNGWSSVIECLVAALVLGAGLGWIIWTERERLAGALRR